MKISEINTLSETEVKKEMEKAKNEKRNYFRFKHRLANNKITNVEVNSYPMVYKDKTLLFLRIRDINNEIRIKTILYFSYFLILTIVIIFLIIFLFLLLNLKKNKLQIEKEISLLTKVEERTKIGGWEIEPTKNIMKCSEQIYKIFEIDKEKENYISKVKEEKEKAYLIKLEFLSNINHEIRTPLNSILGFLDILLAIEENT